MIFLTIPSKGGNTFTINPNQITFIGHFTDDTYYVQLVGNSIAITEEIYTDLLRHIDRVTIDVAEPFLQDKVEDLEFTVRTANCLYNADIIYVHQLLDLTQTDLLKIKNMGRKSLYEIKEKIADKYNAKLKGDQ